MKKGTAGTHYKAERKENGLYLRLSSSDSDMIRGKAEAAGLSITEFIVSACSARRVPGYKKSKTAEAAGDEIPGQLSLDDLGADACDADASNGIEEHEAPEGEDISGGRFS